MKKTTEIFAAAVFELRQRLIVESSWQDGHCGLTRELGTLLGIVGRGKVCCSITSQILMRLLFHVFGLESKNQVKTHV